jgi:16S rRNA (uracil1498-N3)-methyltransferase
LKPGDEIGLFNGRGGEFDAHVEAIDRHGVRARVGAARRPAPEPRVAVTLALAVLKGDKMDDVVRDAVMLGAARVQPMVTERAEVTRASLLRRHRRERWERIAVASAKQCGRATVPAILEPLAFSDLLDGLTARPSAQTCLMLVEPHASASACSLSALDRTPPPEAVVLIGPEGGWTPDEIDRASRVARLVTLGGRTLRADATPIVALAALLTIWGEF